MCGAIQRVNTICDMGKNVADSICMFPQNAKNGISEAAVPFYKKSWAQIKQRVKTAHYFKIEAIQSYIDKGKVVQRELKNLASLNLRVEENHKKTSNIEKLREVCSKFLVDEVRRA